MKIRELLRSYPIHLFAFPVLFVVNHFFSIVVPDDVARESSYLDWSANFLLAIGIVTAIPLVIFALVGLRINRQNSTLLATVISLPLLFFQDLFLSTEALMTGSLRVRWVLPFILIATVLFCYRIFKARRPLSNTNEYLSVISLVLIGYTLAALLMSFDKLRPIPIRLDTPPSNLSCKTCPDIFFLVLDSYTSNRSLRDYFDFDNSSFTGKLKALEFEVADEANSSYDLTHLSICATLNLDGLGDLKRYRSESGLRNLIKRSAVVQSLKTSGYTIHNYSLFDLDDTPMYYSIRPSFGFDLIDRIFHSLSLNQIFELSQKIQLYDQCKEILTATRELARGQAGGRKFVYAHVMAPHPPFVIDSLGAEIGFFHQSRNEINRRAYVNQVQGLNAMVLETITDIRSQSPAAAIVIMGDHGYRFLESDSRVKEGSTVFLAYHGPRQGELTSLAKANQVFELVFFKSASPVMK